MLIYHITVLTFVLAQLPIGGGNSMALSGKSRSEDILRIERTREKEKKGFLFSGHFVS